MSKPFALSALLLSLAACSAGGSLPPQDQQPHWITEPEWAPQRPTSPWSLDYFAPLPQGDTQRAALCGRQRQDAFARWYCQEPTAPVSSLADVLRGLGLRAGDALSPNARFALLAASNSLAVRAASSLNPRGVVYMDGTQAGAGFIATAAARGDNVLEVAATDANTQALNFYLLRTRHPCDESGVCGFADHFGAQNETGWSSAVAYDESDLADTPMDCLRCHQPAGTGTARRLLMQQRGADTDHWMRSDTANGVHWDRFRSAHGGDANALEDYAGIPGATLAPRDLENHGGDPNALEAAVTKVFGPSDPVTFAQALAGTPVLPPYSGDPFDASSVQAAQQAYAYPGQTPSWFDAGNLYSADAAQRVGIAAPASGSDGAPLGTAELVNFKCGGCHNGRFPGTRRNAFDVRSFAAHTLSDGMRNAIRDRIGRGDSDIQRMPPAIFGDLTPSQRQQILDGL